jgi:hypothetical protein
LRDIAGRGVEDRLLQGQHLRRRVDPELPGEDTAELAQRAERLALRPGLVLREDEELPATFAQGCGTHQRVGQREHLPWSPAAQHRVHVHLLRLETQLVEPVGLAACRCPVGEVGEGRTAPPGERLLELEGHAVALADGQELPGAGHPSLELVRVDVVRGNRQHVAVGRGLDRARAEDLAEPHDAGLEVLGRRGGRVVAPDGVGELVRAHRVPQPRGQGLQYDSVVGAETARSVDGQRTKDVDPHPPRVLGPASPVNALCTRPVPAGARCVYQPRWLYSCGQTDW